MKAFLLCGFLLYLRLLSAAPLEEKATAPEEVFSSNQNFGDQNHTPDDNFDVRIVGGYPTTIADFPYQASLQHRGSHICGASIISAHLILTAAHCIEHPVETRAYRVRVGSTYHANGGQLLGVRRVLLHEQYSNTTQDNDVAVVELTSAISFSPDVAPIALAEASGASGGASAGTQQLTVSGWGLTDEMGANVSPVLRCVEVGMLPRAVCAASYREFATISKRMFCAGTATGGKDSCQGDSGGPLVGRLHGERRLFGIVSWGVGCALPEYPGVYADVAALRPWIDRAIQSVRKRS